MLAWLLRLLIGERPRPPESGEKQAGGAAGCTYTPLECPQAIESGFICEMNLRGYPGLCFVCQFCKRIV